MSQTRENCPGYPHAGYEHHVDHQQPMFRRNLYNNSPRSHHAYHSVNSYNNYGGNGSLSRPNSSTNTGQVSQADRGEIALNPRPSSSTINVFNSILTPLAQEFVPAAAATQSSNNEKSRGAVKKSTYWNNHNKYERKGQRNYDYRNSRDTGRSNKYGGSNEMDERKSDVEENTYKRNKTYYKRDNYSKSDTYFRNNNKNGYYKNYRTYGNKEYKGGNNGDSSSVEKTVKRENDLSKKLNAASQKERLEQMIMRRLLECLVCCERLHHTDKIWSCKQCFHIMHLECIKQWAQSSKLENGWRCPACQNVYEHIPVSYFCYCGKQTEPHPAPGGLPHSCGQTCGRQSRCEHKCTIACHPGPCPECSIIVSKTCGCGKTTVTIKCSSTLPITCPNACEKLLNCNMHRCASKCHVGECGVCAVNLVQECFCGKETREVPCDAAVAQITHYECGKTCDRDLACGNHKCTLLCHAGDCPSCERSPAAVTTCPCGKTPLTVERQSCLDAIPLCDQICNKQLNCGQPSAPHVCQVKCHEGACPPCKFTTLVRCRCGHMDKELPCAELTSKADDARCEKKCTKKRLCGKHRCNQRCCIEIDHVCPLICNRNLSCGLHRCEETCHKGRCPPCWRSSFEELYCECGASVLYPPVACGTRPPPCERPCSRTPECGHKVFHTCHTGPCPPCTVLTKKWCHGGHEQRSTILCHQVDFSCGLACGKPMPCGRHKCIQACHTSACKTPCTQPCTAPKPLCAHPCGQPCHEGSCPETSCKQNVKITCECGNRSSTRICMDLAGEYQNIAMAQLAAKIEKMQMGQSVDVSDMANGPRKPPTLKILECNDECRVLERNRRLAIGLQIRNPDINAKLTPRYTDYMRNWAKKDGKFCQYVHDKLTELVQLAKQSKQKSRSFSFETMNREKRHFVHEYCEHFGCESAAYDPEPNRNVVATAIRDRSWLPSYSLLEVIQRESGQRKVPGPQQLAKGAVSKSEAVPLKSASWRLPRPQTPPVLANAVQTGGDSVNSPFQQFSEQS